MKFNINEILKDKNSFNNVVMQSEDRVRVFPQSKFVDKYNFKISGAVRTPGTFNIDRDQNLKISDAITLAGGAVASATDFAYLYRKDPTAGDVLTYEQINIKDIIENPNSSSNITIEPNDEIVLFDKTKFQDKTRIEVVGAVREPKTLLYDESLTLRDAIILAGGFKLQAQNSRIDVFRVDWSSDKETRTYATTISVDEDYNVMDDPNFKLQPFDQIVVRTAPNYGFQKGMAIEGEVLYPGGYALISEEERISSVIERAGGLTKEAFPEGATLYRAIDGIGYIVIKLDEILNDPNSYYNFILKQGDRISIPKKQDYVTILGATKANEIYNQTLVNTGKLTVAFHPGKDAKYYIDKYAGGLGKRARPRLVTVQHLNGELERTRGFLVKNYPEIRPGSIISVTAVPPKIKPEKSVNREKID
ncbi:MAG: SLBB domain-containing protein, partial [Bacteroidota bacterium]